MLTALSMATSCGAAAYLRIARAGWLPRLGNLPAQIAQVHGYEKSV